MLLIVGFLIVLGATLGGFMIAGGQPLVLLHVSEFVVIGGVALGILVVSSPMSILMGVVHQILSVLKGSAGKKDDYVDLLKLLYEVFQLGRRNGLIALESHVLEPQKSGILQRYPSFLKSPGKVEFFCNSLKPLIDGRIKPEHLAELLEVDVAAKEEEAAAPVHVLQLVGDSLPGVGIIAAVLGIINTMSAIADGPEAVGHKVAAALTGTFLGILGAYGFINPLTSRIKVNNGLELQYFITMLKGITGFANGLAPLMAVEAARRCLDHSVQPSADALEEMLKSLPAAK